MKMTPEMHSTPECRCQDPCVSDESSPPSHLPNACRDNGGRSLYGMHQLCSGRGGAGVAAGSTWCVCLSLCDCCDGAFLYSREKSQDNSLHARTMNDSRTYHHHSAPVLTTLDIQRKNLEIPYVRRDCAVVSYTISTTTLPVTCSRCPAQRIHPLTSSHCALISHTANRNTHHPNILWISARTQTSHALALLREWNTAYM